MVAVHFSLWNWCSLGFSNGMSACVCSARVLCPWPLTSSSSPTLFPSPHHQRQGHECQLRPSVLLTTHICPSQNHLLSECLESFLSLHLHCLIFLWATSIWILQSFPHWLPTVFPTAAAVSLPMSFCPYNSSLLFTFFGCAGPSLPLAGWI